MNLKGFAGFAAWGLIAASVSLILVFAFSTLFGLAESLVVNGVNVSASLPNGDTSVLGSMNSIVVKNSTTVLYNFTINVTSGMNISTINITFPAWPFDSASANISLVNTSAAPAVFQLGAPALTGWSTRFVQNYSNGAIKTVELNGTFAPQTINGTNGSVMAWFAFNATSNITGVGNLSDNQTMTWHVYVANGTDAQLTKVTTIVDNNPPRVLLTRPLVNSSGNTYVRGLSNEVFQLNITETALNISRRSSNDGSTNVTLWYKQSGVSTWNAKTLTCYNETGLPNVNDPSKALYMCNTTLDLSQGGALGVLEEDVIDFFFNASDMVLNTGYNGTQASPHKAQVDRTPPVFSNVESNVTYINTLSALTSNMSLNARLTDNFGLGNATLATNETNVAATTFTNYTANNTYASPIRMAGSAYVLNFTWKNTTLKTGFIVGWRVSATDEAGNENTTAVNAFTIDNDAPATHGGFINLINNANVSNVFTVNVSVNDTLSGMSFVYLNISYEAPDASIRGINNITLTQGITGYWNATINSTFNMLGAIADGNYTFRIVANDTLNNLNNSHAIKVWIDNQLPVISVTRPTASQVITGQFSVEALVTDSVRVSNVQYYISNATFSSGVLFQMTNTSGDIQLLNNNSGVYNSTNVTNANVFVDGVYNVTIRANDSANNFTYANVSITIDNVQNATELDAASYTNGTIRKAGQTINLNFTTIGNLYGNFPSGYGYNVSVYIVNSSGTAIFAGNVSNVSQFWANGSITIPTNTAGNVIDDGNRTFQFRVRDNAGNILINGSSNFTVNIDNSAANYSNPTPLNTSYITGTSTQLFQISMTEVNMNISKNVTLYWGNGPAIPSTWNAKTLLCSNSTALYSSLGSNLVCNTTLDLSGQPNNRIIYYFFNNSNVTDPNGDKAGNGGYFGNEIIPLNTTIDRTNPAVGVLLPLGRANVSGSFTLNITANNTPAGISNVSYRITNDTWQSDMILLTRGIGTATAGYWNGTNTTTGLAALGDGLYRISINATDFAGNVNTTVNVTITIDNTKPNVTVVRPTTKQNFSSSISINATVRDSGISRTIADGDIKSVEYILSNGTWTGPAIQITNTTSGPANFFDMYNGTNFTSATLADGLYNITVNATDYANNFNDTQYVSVNIDRNAPTISIRSPTANQFIKGNMSIVAEVNDTVWVWYVQYKIGNGTFAADGIDSPLRMTNISGSTATNNGYYNATNDTSAITSALYPGVYNITVWANDTVNNIVQVNLSVTIDNIIPGAPGGTTGNITSPASGIQYFPNRVYKFNKTFNDSVGVVNVTLEIGLPTGGRNYTAFLADDTAVKGNWSANVTDLAANTTGYSLTWYATDQSGNVLKVASHDYVVNKNITQSVRVEVNGTFAIGGEVNTTTWQRGTAINITAYSSTTNVNVSIFANITQFALSSITYVPYPAGIQNITISNSNMALGAYNITANTTGNDNYTANATAAVITITLQDDAPWSLILSPANNSNISNMFGKMLINVSATDLSGVSAVLYTIGNTTMQTVTTGLLNSTGNIASHYNVSIDTTLYAEGKYNLTISINDTVGNVNSSYRFNITFDRTGPVTIFNYQLEGTRLVGLTPGNNSYRSGTIVANATISDDTSGVHSSHQTIRIGNTTHWMGPTFPMSTISGAFNASNVTTVLADGLYNITITANDTAGNNRTNVTFFYVDNTAPSLVGALSNSTVGTYRANTTEQIRVQINDALQTNATIDIYTRWPNGTTNLYNISWAAPGTSGIYSWRIDTSDLVTDQMVKFYVVATDNASNAATGVGTLASPLSNITINTNCGHVGRALNWCSDGALKTTANGWATVNMPTKGIIEQFSSLQGNYSVHNVTSRSGIWAKFNYTYHYTGSSWLSFDPNSAASENTLKEFNQTNTEYWFNINTSNVVFRIE
ncbi:MAG: hypothetical protein HY516_01945 [Candidatus Aenigmarchaeota archaeon]|nr:hypothetical protein [Candidatus Aenigmarchaeota archaeon]